MLLVYSTTRERQHAFIMIRKNGKAFKHHFTMVLQNINPIPNTVSVKHIACYIEMMVESNHIKFPLEKWNYRIWHLHYRRHVAFYTWNYASDDACKVHTTIDVNLKRLTQCTLYLWALLSIVSVEVPHIETDPFISLRHFTRKNTCHFVSVSIYSW